MHGVLVGLSFVHDVVVELQTISILDSSDTGMESILFVPPSQVQLCISKYYMCK